MNIQPVGGQSYIDRAKSVLAAEEAKKGFGIISVIKNTAWTVTLVGPIMAYFRPQQTEAEVMLGKVVRELKEKLSGQGVFATTEVNNLKSSLAARKESLESARGTGIEILGEVAADVKSRIRVDVLKGVELKDDLESSINLASNLLSRLNFILNSGEKDVLNFENLRKTKGFLTDLEQYQLDEVKNYLNKSFEDVGYLKEKIEFIKLLKDSLNNTKKELDDISNLDKRIKELEVAKAKENIASLAEKALATANKEDRVVFKALSSIESAWNQVMKKPLDLSKGIDKVAEVVHNKIDSREKDALVIWNNIEKAFAELKNESVKYELSLNIIINNLKIDKENPSETLSELKKILLLAPPEYKGSEAVKSLRGLVKTTKQFFEKEQKLLDTERVFDDFLYEIKQAEVEAERAKADFERAYALLNEPPKEE